MTGTVVITTLESWASIRLARTRRRLRDGIRGEHPDLQQGGLAIPRWITRWQLPGWSSRPRRAMLRGTGGGCAVTGEWDLCEPGTALLVVINKVCGSVWLTPDPAPATDD